MPSGFATLDTGFPNIKKIDDPKQQIKAVEDYLVQLLENLRYMLGNIGPENFNETEVVGWIGETITDPINARIANDEGQITQLSLTAAGLSITVGSLAAQTTVYVNSQGMIIQNGTGQQVKIGNGAVKADFFYGNTYYDASGIGSLDLTSATNRHRLIFGLNGQSYANSDFAIDAYDDQGTSQYATMRFYGMDILQKNGFNTSTVWPQGTWNFSQATVTGIPATFG